MMVLTSGPPLHGGEAGRGQRCPDTGPRPRIGPGQNLEPHHGPGLVPDEVGDLVHRGPRHLLPPDTEEDVAHVEHTAPVRQARLLHALDDDGLGVITSNKLSSCLQKKLFYFHLDKPTPRMSPGSR